MSPLDLLAYLTSKDVSECLVRASAAESNLPTARTEYEKLKAAAEELRANNDTLKERLAQAMKRETAAREQYAANTAELTDARNQLEALRKRLEVMREHPDVKRAERARLKEEARALLARAAELDEPAPENRAGTVTYQACIATATDKQHPKGFKTAGKPQIDPESAVEIAKSSSNNANHWVTRHEDGAEPEDVIVWNNEDGYDVKG